MLPALKALSSGEETRISEVREKVAGSEGLTAEDLQELLPSGVQTVFTNRITLIDGPELARLMVAHGVGVRTRIRHEIKRIDEDYFDGLDERN